MTRRSFALILATTTTIATLFGCSLLVDTSGLSSEGAGPGEAGSSGEGGTAGEGGSAGEGGNDGGAGDGAFFVDGNGVDGSVAFCANNPGHGFCDDFDDRTTVASTWTSSDVEGRGAIRSDLTLVRSAPRSFASEATAGGAAMVNVAAVSRDLGSADHVRFAFDFQVTPPNDDAGDSLGTIRFAAGYLDILWFTDGTLRVTERSFDQSVPNVDYNTVSGKVPGNTWVRIQVQVTPGHIDMTLNGVSVISTTSARAYDGAAAVSLGLYSNDALAVGFHYDNVLVDTVF